MEAKQVIVIRRDLKCRRGKEIAQGGHAVMKFLTERLREKGEIKLSEMSEAEQAWVTGRFKKIVCQVDSEEELLAVHRKAIEHGLTSSLVTDAGLTEFNGVPTNTCIGVGPDEASKIDEVTGDLKLY